MFLFPNLRCRSGLGSAVVVDRLLNIHVPLGIRSRRLCCITDDTAATGRANRCMGYRLA